MRSNTTNITTESEVLFQVDTPHQLNYLKELGKGYLTLVDTCSYTILLIDCLSEDNFLSSVREWCENLSTEFPKSPFSCKATLTNRITGCSMYVDAELKGKYLHITERDGTICLSRKSPICIECGCRLKKVVNGRRFECPDCGSIYVSSAYVAEEDSEECGCHVFCYPNDYKIKVS